VQKIVNVKNGGYFQLGGDGFKIILGLIITDLG